MSVVVLQARIEELEEELEAERNARSKVRGHLLQSEGQPTRASATWNSGDGQLKTLKCIPG